VSKSEINLRLHAKQGDALETPATEVLYGGAAGSGKSHLMRAAAVMWCGMIPGLQVYLFRRLRDDLVKNHIEGPQGLRQLLAPWVRGGLVDMVEDEIRFWNGSKIYLCHCKDEKDRFKYLGAEIHVLLIDELTTFTDTIYRFLRSRVRMAGVELPPQFVGRFPRILSGSNPGNTGHGWVKAAFIDARPPMDMERVPTSEGGMLRQFIPARLADNPSIDPGDYVAKLEGLGSPALVKAMRDGDWNVVAGAYFPEFSTETHVVVPRSLPSYWLKFRSFDWGSARPFSVGWWTVSDGELADFPRGAIIRYREWYGAQRDPAGKTIPNTGLRMTAEQVADGIIEREKGDITGNRVMSGVADPSIFAEDGGPSIADRMAGRKVFWRPADNTRVGKIGASGGWDQVRARLIGDGEKPALYVFSTCLDFIRTFPALQHDDGRPEDIDTESEDHLADECRYACLSRPYVAPLPASADQEEPDGYARSWKPGRGRKRGSAMAA
jgi:terminase large subunit-like protein